MPLPFSIHNAILSQAIKEDMQYWAKSDSYFPPTPPYKEVKMKFTPLSMYVFTKQFIKGLRP